MMDYADTPRQGDLDGRGNLSRKALSDFTAWFLRVCLDQVTFMSGLFELDTLVERLRIYVQRREFKPEALHILEQVLQRGELREARRAASAASRSAAPANCSPHWSLTASSAPTPRKGQYPCDFRWMRSRSCSPACFRRHEDGARRQKRSGVSRGLRMPRKGLPDREVRHRRSALPAAFRHAARSCSDKSIRATSWASMSGRR